MLIPVGTVSGAGRGAAARNLPAQQLRHEWDFRTMPTQPLPTTVEALQVAMSSTAAPSSAPAATAIFRFDGTGSDLDLDLVGGSIGFAPGVTAPTRDQSAVGLRLGGSWARAVEVEPDTEQVHRCTTVGAGGIGGPAGSWAFIYVFRLGRECTGQGNLLDCRDTDGKGWRLYIDSYSTSGPDRIANVVVEVFDGSTSMPVTIAAITLDESWHVIGVKQDETANLLHGWIDDDNTDYNDDTSLLAGHIAATDVGVSIGFDNNGELNVAGQQAAYLAWFEGAEAEALTVAHVNTFFKLGSMPSSDITYSRPARIAHTIESGIDGDVVACFGAGRVAYRMAPNWGGVMLATHDLVENLIASSYPEDWTASSVTLAAHAKVAPSGQLTAAGVTSTGANGHARATFTATAGSVHWMSVYLNVDTARTVRIVHGDSTLGTIYDTLDVDVVPTEFGTRFDFSFTPSASGTRAVGIIPDTTAGGGVVYAWGAQVRNWPTPGPIVLATGGTRKCVETDITATPSTDAASAVLGGLYIEWETDVDSLGTEQVIASCHGGLDERAIKIAADDSVTGVVLGADGAATTAPTTGPILGNSTTRFAHRLQWSAGTGAAAVSLPGEVALYSELRDELADVEYDGTGTPFSYAETMTTIRFGGSAGGDRFLEGGIRLVRSFVEVL